METTPQNHPFKTALDLAVHAAIEKYPGDAKRIERGAELVWRGHVELLPDRHIAIVRSGSNDATLYEVNGHCQCIAWKRCPGNRCSHRWAKTLLNRLARMWFAVYDDGQEQTPGIMYPKDGILYFHADDATDKPVYSTSAFVRLGRCDIAVDTIRDEFTAYQQWRQVAEA